MADQTFKAKLVQTGDAIDYYPVAAKPAGSVVQRGGIVGFTNLAIAAGELGALEVGPKVYDVVKDSSVFVDGQAVYYNPTANPVGGTAGTGAATITAAGNIFLGFAIVDVNSTGLTGDVTVRVLLQQIPSIAGLAPVATVVALGTNQGNAAPVAVGFTFVTGADGTVGIKLPDAPAGSEVEIKNGAAFALKVYPFLGDAINAIAVDGVYSMASLTSAKFRKYDATTWYSTPLVAS